MLESTIQTNILHYLKSLKHCEAENVHGDSYSRGRPDINACFEGTLLRIEVKTIDHSNAPTEIQKDNLMRWGRAGAICFVAYSLEDVKYVVSDKGLACKGCLRGNTVYSQCPVKKLYCFTKICCSLISQLG